jgi:hypothetical protein
MMFFVSTLWCTANAQTMDQQAPDMNRQGNGQPPQPPILAALDSNQDNIIGANEIAAAATSLLSLDKNSDGKLSADEYRPAPPQMGNGMGNPPPNGGAGQRKSGMQPPKMPIDSALDANGDGSIDAKEIANAPAALSKLDKNGDGQLTMDECMPQRPESGNQKPSGNF